MICNILGIDKPPCRTLAAFLQITPVSEIDVALDRLLHQNRQSSDNHVKVLASVLCDWLLEWPKATKISHWITSLFKMLTVNGRSFIVADVILQKSAQVIIFLYLPLLLCSVIYLVIYLEIVDGEILDASDSQYDISSTSLHVTDIPPL